MKKFIFSGAVLVLGMGILMGCGDGSPTSLENNENIIRVEYPLSGQVVTSPLTVMGEARGNWFFEASFPVKLEDEKGHVLARVPASTNENWMTEDFVSFEAKLEFTASETDTGALIFEKDNPSGLPENDASVSLPVKFR
ncbi:Gmad2 immunoglobulin-like domain-containing protein [Candidatus Gracilibacteria bacterium]|nr:Gmad2 immunoglobulin-like domain-containing protein [Candidatus Gracilibacteria bacterium]